MITNISVEIKNIPHQRMVSLLKSDDDFINFFDQVMKLSASELEFIENLEDENYIDSITLILTKYRLGKISEFKKNLSKLLDSLFKQKKYSRIIQLSKLFDRYKINIHHYSPVVKMTSMRMHGEDFKIFMKYLDFNDVVNNANIFLTDKRCRDELFKKAEVYPLEDILEALFKSIDSITSEEEFSESLKVLYEKSRSRKLKTIIEEAYRNIKLEEYPEIEKKLKQELELKLEINYPRNTEEQTNQIKQKIFDLKSQLVADDINREGLIHIVNSLVQNYLKLGDTQSAQKLGDYLNTVKRYRP